MLLARIKQAKNDKDGGFTLIELLVVVAIIGILAAIAIPVFLSQRASARDASVKSDMNSMAKIMETYYTDHGAYATSTATLEADVTPAISQGNKLDVLVNGTSFTITGCNFDSGKVFKYDSAAGGLSPDAVSGATCSAATGSGQYSLA